MMPIMGTNNQNNPKLSNKQTNSGKRKGLFEVRNHRQKLQRFFVNSPFL